MKIYQTDLAYGRDTAINPDGADDTTTNRFVFNYGGVNGADANCLPAVGDIIELGPLLADTTVVDAYLDCDKLDSNAAPAVSCDVGILTGTYGNAADLTRTCDQTFYAADTTARAGGVARLSKQTGFRVASSGADRGIGVKITAVPATVQNGTLALVVLTRAANK